MTEQSSTLRKLSFFGGWGAELKDYALIALGVLLYSIGMTVFMLPYSLTIGGVAGIASIIYYTTGVEVQVTYVTVNIFLLILAVKMLGIRFCIKTIYAVALMTFTLWFIQRLIEIPDPANPGTMMLPKLIGDESFMACVCRCVLSITARQEVQTSLPSSSGNTVPPPSVPS